MPDTLPKGAGKALRDDSDALMSAMDKLKRMEAEKRREPITSRRFHEEAGEVEKQARRVFELALVEDADGREVRRQEEVQLGRVVPDDGGGNPAIDDAQSG